MRLISLAPLRKLVSIVRAFTGKLWPRAKPVVIGEGHRTDIREPSRNEDGSAKANDSRPGEEAERQLADRSSNDEKVDSAKASTGNDRRQITDVQTGPSHDTDAGQPVDDRQSTPDTQRPSPENIERPDNDDLHTSEDEKEEKAAESKRPQNRGGQRNLARGHRSGESTSKLRKPESQYSPVSRPELICREAADSWKWEVVLSASDECRLTKVLFNDEPLNLTNGESHLPALTGRLTVVFEDGRESEISLFEGEPLLFKLRQRWCGEGRRVRRITKGHFIVIVPNDWKRNGHAPVEPGGCVDSSFMAHHFFWDGETPAEEIGGFQQCEALPISSGFELIGDRVFDDSEDGDLFVGTVPNLKLPSDIAWVRVGEERKGGWPGANFEKEEKSLREVLEGRRGRFFVRVYNSQLDLLDSGQFRYLQDLREIRVNDVPYDEDTILAPLLTGYPPAQVSFIGVDGTAIQPVDVTHGCLQGDCVVAEPDADGDIVLCTLKSGDYGVGIKLVLPRIWWRLERSKKDSCTWRDTPILLTRQKFQEYAHAGAEICLRLPERINVAHVGFDDQLDRRYRRRANKDFLLIPLVYFSDYPQIVKPLNEDAWFGVECAGEAIKLMRVVADPAILSFTCAPEIIFQREQTTLSWQTKSPETCVVAIDPGLGSVDLNGSLRVTPSRTTTYTLRLAMPGMDDVTETVTITVDPRQLSAKPFARVKRAGGRWRNGRGFSYGELQEAGLAKEDAICRTIAIDRRRQTTHSRNTRTLRRLIDDR